MGDESLGGLVSRVVDDGKRLVQAEVDLYKQIAVRKVAGFQTAVVLAVAALFFVQAALTTLLVGLGFAIAHWIGIAGGVIVAALLGFAAAGLMVWIALRKFSTAASADPRKAAS